MNVNPYLYFNGRCEEAVEFYRRVLGAEVISMHRFKDSPDPNMIQPGMENKIMHMTLRIGDLTVLASDGDCGGTPKLEGFSMSINLTNDAQAERMFAALAEGGQVQMPLSKTFFASRFGMLADRFGVCWMIHVPSS